MTDTRRRVVRAGRPSSVKSVLRRRRTGVDAVDRSMDADIVPISDEESYAIAMLRKIPGVVDGHRNAGHVHISTLLTGCLRKIAISEKFRISVPSTIVNDSLGITFAQGHAIHDFVKNQFVRAHPDKMYGEWSCLCGETRTEPMVKADIPTRPCKSCHLIPSIYNEVGMVDEEHGIVGSPDVILYTADPGYYYVIEIKSIAHEQWKEIVRPKPDHVLQVVFYWYLMRKAGHNVPQYVSILYVTKGFNFKNPYKEFMVDPVSELDRLSMYLDDATDLVMFRGGGPIPPRKMCSSAGCATARQCHVNTVCFNLPG